MPWLENWDKVHLMIGSWINDTTNKLGKFKTAYMGTEEYGYFEQRRSNYKLEFYDAIFCNLYPLLGLKLIYVSGKVRLYSSISSSISSRA